MNPGKKYRIDTNIFLIGFMGAGKSTVGKLLAEKLKCKFFDTDRLIESESGFSIAEIFSSKGEPYFRQIESEVIKDVAAGSGKVVAVGGGAVLAEKNWNCIEGSGVSIYLRWHPQVLIARICNDSVRPLVAAVTKAERNKFLLDLFERRRCYYERADLIIENLPQDGPYETVTKITHLLKENL